MSDPRPTKADRREEARLAAQRVKEQQDREAKRQRNVLIVIVGVALVAIVAVVVYIFSNAPAESSRIAPIDFSETEDPLGEVDLPAGATSSGGILLGQDGVIADGQIPEGDTVVRVYADYMCPHCATFETLNGPGLDELRAEGGTVVELHPVAIMDGASAGTQYSTRASAAVAYVADNAPDVVADFNYGLFVNQPQGTGLTDVQIADIAAEVGAEEAVVEGLRGGAHVAAGGFRAWVAAATEQAARDLPRLATPTVHVDGVDTSELGIDWRTPGALVEAVRVARGAAQD